MRLARALLIAQIADMLRGGKDSDELQLATTVVDACLPHGIQVLYEWEIPVVCRALETAPDNGLDSTSAAYRAIRDRLSGNLPKESA